MESGVGLEKSYPQRTWNKMLQGVSPFTPEIVFEDTFSHLVADLVDAEEGEGPIADEIYTSMVEATSLVAKLISEETPVNLGHLSGAIAQATDVNYGGRVWQGEVGDGGIPYGFSVNFGRKPGKMPPVDDIEYWIIRKQLQWHRTLASGQSKAMTTREMAWALAKHIAKEGTDGVFMFEEGVKKAKPHVEAIWGDLMDRIEQVWGEGV